VVQAYLSYPGVTDAPRLALVGFQRVSLAAGEQRTVQLHLDSRALSLVDADGVRAIREGRYELFVRGRQPTAEQLPVAFTITGHADMPH